MSREPLVARIAWPLAVLGIGVGGAVAAYQLGWIRLGDPELAEYPVRGIDVSHHQGQVEWSRVKDQVSFVYVKATEGRDLRDPRFRSFWRKAGASGITRGAYHYFSLCAGGGEQADNFLATVPPDQTMLPPAIDVEYAGNCSRYPSSERIRVELTEMIDRLHTAHGRWPVLYVSKRSYQSLAKGLCGACPLWIRAILGRPVLDGGEWTFWQFSDDGVVDGVRQPVDLDVFRGDAKALSTLVGKQR